MSSGSDSQAKPPSGDFSTILIFVLLAVAVAAVYANSLFVPFLFDDEPSLLQNASLQSLGTAFSPPTGYGITVGGRPVLNASFALNYALSGFSPLGFHLGNLVIHVLAAFVLFLLARDTLRLPALAHAYAPAAVPLAAVGAAVWAVHPLQTEAVTYIVQRAESQVGLFYLLTLYLYLKYTEKPSITRLTFAFAACLLGMGTKEVMVSAPLVSLLYDRCFVSGTFATAWSRHRNLLLALASTWLLLGCLVVAEKARGGSIGSTEHVGWFAYLLTQPVAILRYLGLAVWPSGQIFDYGIYLETRSYLIAGAALLVVSALAASLLALSRRRSGLGFLSLSFFLVLAPSSSFVPIATQTIAEHRMYLPLAAVVFLGIILGYRAIGARSLVLWFVAIPCLALASVHRNSAYKSEVSLWTDTVQKLPGNERAHNNLAIALAGIDGRQKEALAHYETALRLRPDYGVAHNNLGLFLLKSPGLLQEALAHFERAVALNPGYADAQVNLGNVLLRIPGRESEALAHYDAALRANPLHAEAHNNRANLLFRTLHRPDEAFAEYDTALSLKPNYAEAHFNYAAALSQTPGRTDDAISHFHAALVARPNYVQAHNSLGNLLSDLPGHLEEAISEYRAALATDPDCAEAHCNLASALMSVPGSRSEAIDHYKQALRLKPDQPEISLNLAKALLASAKDAPAGAALLETVLRVHPNNADAHLLLGEFFLSNPPRLDDAVTHLKASISSDPNRAEAHNDLGIAFAQSGDLSAALSEFDRARTLKPSLREASDNYESVRQALSARQAR